MNFTLKQILDAYDIIESFKGKDFKSLTIQEQGLIKTSKLLIEAAGEEAEKELKELNDGKN
jgi:hypothetical protein